MLAVAARRRRGLAQVWLSSRRHLDASLLYIVTPPGSLPLPRICPLPAALPCRLRGSAASYHRARAHTCCLIYLPVS